MTSANFSPNDRTSQGSASQQPSGKLVPANVAAPVDKPNSEVSDFAREANEKQPGLVAELWDFARHNKKWWLTPIILVMLLLGFFILLLATPAAPFIYTLF